MMERQVEEQCTAALSVRTPYNENALIPAYAGIMFDIVSLNKLDIVALQFDARIDLIEDFTVEVFMTNGNFVSKLNDESQWTRLAHTEATIAPSGGGLLIPQAEFKSVTLSRGERRSFYISMKGPWIDTRAEALDKTGEVQQQDVDMALYVGVGLNERFPVDFDKTVDPQFAGVIHYRKQVTCQEKLENTEVDLSFLASRSEDPIFVSRFGRLLEETIQQNMLKASPFSEMVKEYSLGQYQSPQVAKELYKGEVCPETWEICPQNFLSPRIFLEHSKHLDKGFLEFEIYRFSKSLTVMLQDRLSTREVAYVGLAAVVSDYELTLGGVPQDELLSSENQLYLEKISTEFLSTSVAKRETFVKVMSTKLIQNEIISSEGRRLRGLAKNSGTLRVEGSIMGAQASYLPAENFSIVLHDSMRNQNNEFMNAIKAGASVVPRDGESKTSAEYFGNINSLKVSFNANIVEPGQLEESSSPNITMFVMVAVSLLILAIAVKLTCCVYQKYQSHKAQEKRQEVIAEKKREKAIRLSLRQSRKESRASIPAEVNVSIESDKEGVKKDEDPKRSSVRRTRSSDGNLAEVQDSLRKPPSRSSSKEGDFDDPEGRGGGPQGTRPLDDSRGRDASPRRGLRASRSASPRHGLRASRSASPTRRSFRPTSSAEEFETGRRGGRRPASSDDSTDQNIAPGRETRRSKSKEKDENRPDSPVRRSVAHTSFVELGGEERGEPKRQTYRHVSSDDIFDRRRSVRPGSRRSDPSDSFQKERHSSPGRRSAVRASPSESASDEKIGSSRRNNSRHISSDDLLERHSSPLRGSRQSSEPVAPDRPRSRSRGPRQKESSDSDPRDRPGSPERGVRASVSSNGRLKTTGNCNGVRVKSIVGGTSPAKRSGSNSGHLSQSRNGTHPKENIPRRNARRLTSDTADTASTDDLSRPCTPDSNDGSSLSFGSSPGGGSDPAKRSSTKKQQIPPLPSKSPRRSDSFRKERQDAFRSSRHEAQI